MDFDKIYTDFEAARRSDDFDTQCDILAQVHRHCNKLASLGRGNELPPSALYICSHVNVLIHRVTQLLSDGDAPKAKAYLMALAADNIAGFDKFFHMHYLLARAFYATGDYVWASKIFARYDAARAANFGDIDELSLFHRGTCAALTGDFDTAAQLYRQALTLKADFPEARHNLESVLRGSNENLVREVESLWNFPTWQDVPIFINARDRVGVLRRLIDWLLGAGCRNVIVLDNASTYPPLLDYYSQLNGVKIIRLGKNFGFKALWQSGVLEYLKISTPYVYTDPDVLPTERCPKDFVRLLMKLLDANRELRKVGLGLVWEDVKLDSIRQTEADFYEGTRVGENLYFAQVDTTPALYSNTRHYSLRLALRTAGDLRAYHLPWYFDYRNLPDDERYYLAHADKNSVTTVKNFWGG